MKNTLRPWRCVCFWTILCSVSLTAICAGQSELKVLWTKTFQSDEQQVLSPAAVSYQPQSEKIIMIGTAYNIKAGHHTIWLWRMDAMGHIEEKTILTKAPKLFDGRRMSGPMILKGFASSEKSGKSIIPIYKGDDTLFLVVDHKTKESIILAGAMNSQGEVAVKGKIQIQKSIPLDEGAILHIGQNHKSGVSSGGIVKTDFNGKLIWQKTYRLSDHQVEIFVDGVPIDNESFAVVGISTNTNGPFPSVDQSENNNHILLCDNRGNRIKTRSFKGSVFPGKHPRICRLTTGTFIIAYDNKPASKGGLLHIRAYNNKLDLLWDKLVYQKEGGLFLKGRIGAILNGEFIILAMINMEQILLRKYDEDGKQLNSLIMDIVSGIGRFFLLCTEKYTYVIYETSDPTDQTKNAIIMVCIKT